MMIDITLVLLYLLAGHIWARKVSEARPAKVTAHMISRVLMVSWVIAGLLVVCLRWAAHEAVHAFHTHSDFFGRISAAFDR